MPKSTSRMKLNVAQSSVAPGAPRADMLGLIEKRMPLPALRDKIFAAIDRGDGAAITALRKQEETLDSAASPRALRPKSIVSSLIWKALERSTQRADGQAAFVALSHWLDALSAHAALGGGEGRSPKNSVAGKAILASAIEDQKAAEAQEEFFVQAVEMSAPVAEWMLLAGGWPLRLRPDGVALAQKLCARGKRSDGSAWAALFEAAEGEDGLPSQGRSKKPGIWRGISVAMAQGVAPKDLQALWDRRKAGAAREAELAKAIDATAPSRHTRAPAFDWALKTARSCPTLAGGQWVERALERACAANQLKNVDRLLQEPIDWSRCWALGHAMSGWDCSFAPILIAAGAPFHEPASSGDKNLSPLCAAISQVAKSSLGEAWIRQMAAKGVSLRGPDGDAEPLRHALEQYGIEAVQILDELGGILPRDWELIKRATGWRPDGSVAEPFFCAVDADHCLWLSERADVLRAEHEAAQLRGVVEAADAGGEAQPADSGFSLPVKKREKIKTSRSGGRRI